MEYHYSFVAWQQLFNQGHDIIMNFTLTTDNLLTSAKQQADLLIVLLQTQASPPETSSKGVQATIAQAMQAGHFSAKKDSALALYQDKGWAAPRALLLGVDASQTNTLQAALEKHIKAHSKDCTTLAICFAQQPTPEQLHAAMQAANNACYTYTHTKPSAKAGLQKVIWSMPQAAACRAAFDYGQALIGGMALAREWGNRPANFATPSKLADAAKHIAKQGNAGSDKKAFTCDVLDRAKVEKLGMGAFLSVAQGSDEPLRFIVLQYKGAGSKKQQPLVFVGKGITFDSGGISIKPGAGMDEMKFDMCGAASVLGLFESLRLLRPAIDVIGLIPACENMPNGRATKPGDVVTSMSGQTIEVLNTDAEGRLVLCDALTYAERFKPLAVIDIATLTGNCVMALGSTRAGLFSCNDPLAQALELAANNSHDLCWRMPMDDAYGKSLHSNFADVANIGARTAGAISAAKFLQRFTKKYPWAHLDIAGVAWNEGAAKGATGRPVPLLLQFVAQQAKAPQAFEATPSKPAPTADAAKAPKAAPARATKAVTKAATKRQPSAK